MFQNEIETVTGELLIEANRAFIERRGQMSPVEAIVAGLHGRKPHSRSDIPSAGASPLDEPTRYEGSAATATWKGSSACQ